MAFVLALIFTLSGVGLVVAGVALIYPPAALILAGVALLSLGGLAIDVGLPPSTRKKRRQP